jgi:cell division protein FtsA
VLGRSVRVGRPKQLTGLPDAHSGPAFSTLVGLACLASSRSGDIRDLTTGKKKEKQASGVMGRLLAAMKGGI